MKLELLAPAGDRERLEAAVHYGADAVYLGGGIFGMRASAAFPDEEAVRAAVAFAHAHGVQVYLTCNTLPTNEEADRLPAFLDMADGAGVDALIVADLGVMMAARRQLPHMPLHVSTQAGVVNHLAASELHALGASRVVLARELSIADLTEIRRRTPPALELEAFVHGAMCMSFSGRCLLSSYMIGRDANRGACAQPCRWRYHLMEEKRPGQYFPVYENDAGSYILNAQDLCMIEHLGALERAGVTSFKIEGRAKSAYYTATVTNAYRGALDAMPGAAPAWAIQEVRKVSHRAYSTGFYMGERPGQCLEDGGYIRDWEVIAVVEAWRAGWLTVVERNRFSLGEKAEIMLAGQAPAVLEIGQILDAQTNEPVHAARHPMRRYEIAYTGGPVEAGSMIRRAAKPHE